ncbi:MAG: prephenate dehydrogenase [Acidimicrobiales bacterium]
MTGAEMSSIGVIGLGQIGGAIALRAHVAGAVVRGYDPDQTTRALAVANGLEVVDTLEAVLDGCGLIVVAVPTPLVEATVASLAAVARRHREQMVRVDPVVICDVASVKTDLPARIGALIQGTGLHYVSVHPMAGREQSGFVAADDALLADRVWLLPLQGSEDLWAVGVVIEVLTASFRARVLPLPFERHDALVALTSHLPHALSFAYAGIVEDTDPDLAPRSAGNSFGDLTRVAHSSPLRVAEMLTPNVSALVALLDAYLAELSALRTLLAAGDDEGVTTWLRARSLSADSNGGTRSELVVIGSVMELLKHAASGDYLTEVVSLRPGELECRFEGV